MRRTRLVLLLAIAAGVGLALSARPAAQSPERIDFARDVQPLCPAARVRASSRGRRASESSAHEPRPRPRVGLAAAAYPPDPATDALARDVKRRQFADGSWHVASHRPPIESSDIAFTALALRSLQAYAPAPLNADYARASQRGAAWLAKATAKSNEDHTYLVLGLTWAGASRGSIRTAASALIAQQRADGGWSQLATLPSDAYATGQALTALAEAGAVLPSDPVYQRGVRFLLETQLEDGSWFVPSRAIPIQPYPRQ